MNDFSKKIMTAIDERKAQPKPRWHFLLKRSIVWLLAVLSVSIGGVAVSVATYVFFDNDGLLVTANKAFQDALTDIIQSIPYIWLAVFALFTLSAYFVFRKTKKGYRYMTVQVVAIVLVLSIALGVVLDALDFGRAVHTYLQSNAVLYDMLVHSSDDESN